METKKMETLEKNEESSSGSEIEYKPKPKRVMTEKQKEIGRQNLAKGRERRDALRRENIEKKKLEEDEKKKEMESKIVRKAITIKKKQLKMEKVLELSEDADSEDDRPPPIRRIARPKAPPNTPVIKPTPTPAPPPRFVFF